MIPLSTYRLQFGPHFRFDDARAILPYLRALGIDWIYSSPYLKARPGSEHGYDVVDPNALNPEIGSREEYEAFVGAAQATGFGHLVDFVPNHMGIGADNPWWQDVLEWGRASPFAHYFDIDWEPLQPEMHGRVLIPALDDYYGRTLEGGKLVLAFDPARGAFSVRFHEREFPLEAESYAEILGLAAERAGGDAWALRALAAEFRGAAREQGHDLQKQLAGAVASDASVARAIEGALEAYRPGSDPAAVDRLDALLGRQHYRLSYWRVSADEINYRRFFDINDLAGVRVEDAGVLAATHRLIFDELARGHINGLRIDHIDGLFDPAGYASLLGARAEALGQPLYLVAEKILARFESLRADWPVAGTTGYDFMNEVNALFVDSRHETAFDRLYRRFAGISADFELFAYRAKKDIMRLALAGELEVLATSLERIARSDRRSSDLSYNVLRDALTETVASFPVYRTYVAGDPLEAEDRRYIGWALGLARKRSELGDAAVFDFLESVLTLEACDAPGAHYERRALLGFVMKLQQYTAPVMAKAVEDTAFYRYVRLASLNEVGGDPRRFGTSVAAFHRATAQRAAEHPSAMLATATHDHKRGEDTRLRIDALSEMPGPWDRALRRWSSGNARRKTYVDNLPAPTENDEYHLYQVLIGTWPAKWLFGGEIRDDELDGYIERIESYLRKALREAKFRTNWANPNLAYEAGALGFVRAILQSRRGAFLRDLSSFASECATLGAISSLAQTTLKLTVPGVPDVYQGTEYWDLTLVDPDNRRPVDYALRAATISGFTERLARGELAQLADELARTWTDGRVKAFVTWRLLHLRRELPEIFRGSSYLPIVTEGAEAERIVAFARDGLVVAVPRLARGLAAGGPERLEVSFGDERLLLPDDVPEHYVDRFTGNRVDVRDDDGVRYIRADALFERFPVSVLVPER